MTEKQIEVLRMSIKGVHFYDDLDDSGRDTIQYLARLKYVETESLDPPIYRITQKGLAKLEALDDMAQKVNQAHAEKKAEHAKDHRFQLINTLVSAVLGGIVTLIVEHFDSILSFLQGLTSPPAP